MSVLHLMEKYQRFSEIPQFTPWGSYAVDISWSRIEAWVNDHVENMGLDLDPDFQRGHVWKPAQKVRYVEFILRGGRTGKDIITNHRHWNTLSTASPGDYVLVDGKQRLEAVRGFMRNEFPVFGDHYRQDFQDEPRITHANFRWHVNDLPTRKEVLQWYLDLNSGGTVHSQAELDRVTKLLEKERAK